MINPCNTFSIIIPVFNSKDYLKDCIVSLSEQTYQDFEVILINDGSTDGSEEYCENLKKSFTNMNIKVFHQKNSGQIEARYLGIKNAESEYCCFLDSDDSFEANTLESILKVINKYQVDIVIFNGQRCLNGYSFPFWPEYNNKETLYTGNGIKKIQHDLIFTRRFNNLTFKSIRTTILKESLIYKNVSFIREEEDLLMQLPVFDKVKSIVYIPQKLYNYSINPTSVTHRYNKNRFPALSYVLNERLKYAIKWGFEGFDKIRFNVMTTGVRNTLFNLRNFVFEDKHLVISEIKSIRNCREFQELYNFRNSITYSWITFLSLRLIYYKFYNITYILVILYRIVFGIDKKKNIELPSTFSNDSLL